MFFKRCEVKLPISRTHIDTLKLILRIQDDKVLWKLAFNILNGKYREASRYDCEFIKVLPSSRNSIEFNEYVPKKVELGEYRLVFNPRLISKKVNQNLTYAQICMEAYMFLTNYIELKRVGGIMMIVYQKGVLGYNAPFTLPFSDSIIEQSFEKSQILKNKPLLECDPKDFK